MSAFRLQCTGHGLLCPGRVGKIDGNDVGRASQAVVEAAAAIIERGVADFLVHAEGVGHAFSGHGLSGDQSCFVLRLADMDQYAEVGEDVTAGVHRDDGDAGGNGRLDGGSECVGVGNRHDEAVRFRSDGGFDDLTHLNHVERAGCLVLDVDAHVLTGGRDASLGNRPERVGRLAVGHDDKSVVALRDLTVVAATIGRGLGGVAVASGCCLGAAVVVATGGDNKHECK